VTQSRDIAETSCIQVPEAATRRIDFEGKREAYSVDPAWWAINPVAVKFDVLLKFSDLKGKHVQYVRKWDGIAGIFGPRAAEK
jgi:hypothetical protein